MKTLMNKVRRVSDSGAILRDERGLSTVEYVIILVLIAAAAISLWINFGQTLTGKIKGATTDLEGVTDAAAQGEGTGTGSAPKGDR